MAGNNEPSPMRPEAQKILKMLDGVHRAFDNALGRIQAVKYDDQQILLSQSISTAINNAQLYTIRGFISDSQIDRLIATMHSHKKRYLELVAASTEKLAISNSMEWSVAETEAQLKGFTVSGVYENQDEKATVLKQGKREKISALEMKSRVESLEQATAEKKAIQQAILDLSNQNISPGIYSTKVLQRAQELIKSNNRQFSPDVLERCCNGGQKIDKKQLNIQEKEAISTAISQMLNKFNGVLSKVDYKEIELAQSTKRLTQSINDRAIKELSLKGYKIDETRRKKIEDQLSPILLKFDSKYLEKYSHRIAKDISEKLVDKKSWSSLLSSSYTISTKELEKIAKDIDDKHFTAYLKVSTTNIENKIAQLYSSAGDKEINEKLANNLTQFLRETSKRIEVGKEFFSQIDATKLKKITNAQLADIRESDRKRFDELIFSALSSKESKKTLNEPQMITREIPAIVKEQLPQVFKDNLRSFQVSESHIAANISPKQHLAPLFNRGRTNSLGKS